MYFEFRPHCYAKISKKYKSGNVYYVETLEVKKILIWDRTSDTCDEVRIKLVAQAVDVTTTIPFMITLLPENSIEEFCYLMKQQI